MKRLIFLALALVLTITGAAWAQSPTTSAPTGASQEREPQPANNDLRNPGNPQDQATGTSTQSGSTTSSSDTSGSSATTTNPPSSGTYNNTTGSTAGTTGTTGSTTYNNSTSTTDTTGSTTDTTGTTSTSTDTTGTSGTSTTTHRHLPRTGSDMPLVGLIGLIALASALGLRTYAKRNA